MPRRTAALILTLASLAGPAALAQPTPTPTPTPAPAPAPTPTPEGEASIVRDLVKSATRHWSFAAPKGWALAPPEVAERIDAEMSRLMPEKGFTCVAVVLADPSRGTRGPNIQVQFSPADYRGVTLDQIDKSLKDTRDLAAQRERERKAAGGRVVGSEETPPALDRQNLRITSMGTITVPRPAPDPAEVIRFESIGFLGRDGVTRLLIYAPEAEFPAAREAAVDAVEDFQYDKGWGWPEATPEGALRAVLRQSGLGLIAVVAVVVGLRMVFRKKSGARRA